MSSSQSPGSLVVCHPPAFPPSPPRNTPLSPWFAAITNSVERNSREISPLVLGQPLYEADAASNGWEEDIILNTHYPLITTSASPLLAAFFGDITHGFSINSFYLSLVRSIPLHAPLPWVPPHAPARIVEEEEEASTTMVPTTSTVGPHDLDVEMEDTSESSLVSTLPLLEEEASQDHQEHHETHDAATVWHTDFGPVSDVEEDEEYDWTNPRKPVGRFAFPSPELTCDVPQPALPAPAMWPVVTPALSNRPPVIVTTVMEPAPPAMVAKVVTPAPPVPAPRAPRTPPPAPIPPVHIPITRIPLLVLPPVVPGPASGYVHCPVQSFPEPLSAPPSASLAFLSPSPEPWPTSEPEPEPEPEVRPKNLIPKRTITLARKTASQDDEDEEDSGPKDSDMPLDEQWRVGKTPGHQGSHSRVKRRAEALEEDEKYDSNKILKRPFRTPTRISNVVVKKVKHVAVSSSPPTAPSSEIPPSPPSKSSTRSTVLSVSASSTATSSSVKRTPTRLAKPFRPLTRSAAPSPSSRGCRSTAAGKLRLKPIDPDADLVAALDKRIRTLRQAVKYVSSEDEDERLARLVHTWREAGREVSDRLFALLPQPSEDDERRGKRASSSWGWGWDDEDAAADRYQPEPLTKEQVQYFLDAPTNANGDAVDENGVPLFGDDVDDDMSKIIERASASTPQHRGESKGHMDIDIPLNSDIEEDTPNETVWDRGAMLLKLGVDPSLLGFDRESDDWEDIDDE